MTFEKEKKDFLTKKDKSKKGIIDKEIRPLVQLISKLPNFYTKSSCSGRIVLLKKKSDRKQEAEWLFVKHGAVAFNEITKTLKKLPQEDIWLKQEPLIMHVCCTSLYDANKLLKLSKNFFKRSGIIGIKKFFTLEIIGTDTMDTLIARNSKLLVSENYLRILIQEANKKLKRNSKKIKDYYQHLKASF